MLSATAFSQPALLVFPQKCSSCCLSSEILIPRSLPTKPRTWIRTSKNHRALGASVASPDPTVSHSYYGFQKQFDPFSSPKFPSVPKPSGKPKFPVPLNLLVLQNPPAKPKPRPTPKPSRYSQSPSRAPKPSQYPQRPPAPPSPRVPRTPDSPFRPPTPPQPGVPVTLRPAVPVTQPLTAVGFCAVTT